jgi:HK97 gp10 family phage protein
MSAGNMTSGFEEFARALDAMETRIATQIAKTAAREGAKIIADRVAAAAPVGVLPDGASQGKKRIPHAKLSTHVKVKIGQAKGSDRTKVKYIVHTGDAYHALMVEHGTIHMPARPWFHNALAASGDAALETIAATLRAGIDRAA